MGLHYLLKLLFHVQVKDAVIYDELLQTCTPAHKEKRAKTDKIRGRMIDICARSLLHISLHAVLWAKILKNAYLNSVKCGLYPKHKKFKKLK